MAVKYGIDVSHCQGKISWEQLRVTNPDVKFAIIRTGYSFGDNYRDLQFENNVAGCKKNGIDIIGVYHFSYAISESTAVKEAKYCINKLVVNKLPKSTIVFFDFEYAGEEFCKHNKVTCDTDFIRKITTAFCNEIKAAGYIPGVYLNEDYNKRLYANWFPKDAKVWAARWVNYSGGNKASDVRPINNKELEQAKIQPTFKFDVWQYGATWVPGTGVVDADVIFETTSSSEPVKMGSKKSNEEVAAEVVRGEWGNGAERMRRLEEAGYNYRAVQAIVNTYYE